MATRTQYYRLTKPEGTDLVDIEDLNGNFDIIDSQLKTNADAARNKQDALTFDEAPVSGSRNPVRSGGIYTALSNKQDTLTFDSVPVQRSTKPVYSGGIYSALQEKQDDLTQVPTVRTIRETDYLFIERGGTIYKILASEVITPSGDDGDNVETENGNNLLTESGEELLADN